MRDDYVGDIKSKITDDKCLRQNYVIRNGFVFESLGHPPNVFDAITLHVPENARTFGRFLNLSTRSIEEHISFINAHKIEKAWIIAENLEFLAQCPSLRRMNITPADSADINFDISPLYDFPEVHSLFINTKAGKFSSNPIRVDYSKINGLVSLVVDGNDDLKFQKIKTLKSLHVRENPSQSLTELLISANLDTLQLTNCRIRTLDGIGIEENLQCLYLYYNRNLSDINSLENVKHSLRALRIQNSPKIQDFSVLEKLTNLEFLWLEGSNKLPSLSFVKKLPHLKTLIFTMEILDGDITPCSGLSYVSCNSMRRYYNMRAKDLPKKEYFRGNDNIEEWRKVW